MRTALFLKIFGRNALRTLDIVRRSPVSIPLRYTAEGGGSFALRHAYSEELPWLNLGRLLRTVRAKFRVGASVSYLLVLFPRLAARSRAARRSMNMERRGAGAPR